jgi:hypothetical protein
MSMDAVTRGHCLNIHSPDREIQGAAYSALMEATKQPVDWAYEVWDELVLALGHKEGRNRSIAVQLLCNLAMSDPEHRVLRDFDSLLAITKDPKYVTARHALQASWRIGLAGPKHQAKVVRALEARFAGCAREKNCTLTRYDIIEGLRRLRDATGDAQLQQVAVRLIATEPDAKYRRKYEALWR